ADAAFLHYAGTMEMAALSAFMQEGTSQRNYPHPYMENAIATYLQNCKNQLLATRGTFLSAEALKTKKMYAEAAVQYIKMTTENAHRHSRTRICAAPSCLSSRPLLPAHAGAARAQVRIPPHPGWSPVLQSRQRAHSLRCYRAALRVYRDRGWTLAEDHINLVLTKHSAALRELESAKDSAYRLLRHDSRQKHSRQNSRQNTVLEQELKLLLSRPSSQLDDLSIPARGVHFQDADLCHPEWSGLERALLEAATGRSAPPSFRPSLPCLSRNTPNEKLPSGCAGEPLTYQIPLRNPAQIPLILRDVCLLWRLNGGGGETPADANAAAAVGLVTNEIEASQMHFAREAVTTEQLAELSLLPGERNASRHRPGFHSLLSSAIGGFHLWRVAAAAAASQGVRRRQVVPLERSPGRRLNRRREDWQSVALQCPALQLSFIRFPSLPATLARCAPLVYEGDELRPGALTGLVAVGSKQLGRNFTFRICTNFSTICCDSAGSRVPRQAALAGR
uniref:Foie-gras_1 domain-containing protein n=1 Tax=Macrostomum lignano TaxID=282301 RepID=A0A1I8JS12_9PLAT